MAERPSLEGIVARFRREAAQAELEVRLRGLNAASFAAIYRGLLAGGPDRGRPGSGGPDRGAAVVGPGRVSRTVSSVMESKGRAPGPGPALSPSLIREISFASGGRTEKFVIKTPLTTPFRGPEGGIPYVVSLASEQPTTKFSCDETALIRVKARVSFPLAFGASPPSWRIDATAVRQVAGGEARVELQRVVAQLLADWTAETFLEHLAGAADLYRYELEAELLPAGAAGLRPADIVAAADTLRRLANPDHAAEEARQVEIDAAATQIVRGTHLRNLSLKKLLPQAVALTRAAYQAMYPPTGLFLTAKADGQRGIAALRRGRARIVTETRLLEAAGAAGAAEAYTAVDGELVKDVFYAFDVIAEAGVNLTREPFEVRLGRLEKAAAALCAAGLQVVPKAYTRLAPENLEASFRAAAAGPHPFPSDGLVLVEPGKAYDETLHHKWKSAGDTTIDFLARRAPRGALGRAPFADAPGGRLYFLFVGVTPDLYRALGLRLCQGYAELFPAGAAADAIPASPYFPVQFSPSDVPLAYLFQHQGSGDLDNTIVELACPGGCPAAGGGGGLPAWHLVRVREDRGRALASGTYFGNDFHSAEMTWLNFVDPFPLDHLWGGEKSYFASAKPKAYTAQTAVLSFVKTQRILALRHANWVVDIGSGRGQDLGRYLAAEVRHLVCVDRDRSALAELVRRRHGLARAPLEKGRRGAPRVAATTVHVLAADAAAPHRETLALLESLGLREEGGDALVCNLAVHYFLESANSLRNFCALARGVVRPGGSVVLTVLRGEAVHALFQASQIPPGGEWSVREPPGDVVKYALKRLYAGEALEAAGQRIGVLLPFSDGQYYEEFLVNQKALEAEFAARGFSLVAAAGVADALRNPELREVVSRLTGPDRAYLALYGELVFRRND